eukprot:1005045-Alexandrium_andersonii.AAC.1
MLRPFLGPRSSSFERLTQFRSSKDRKARQPLDYPTAMGTPPEHARGGVHDPGSIATSKGPKRRAHLEENGPMGGSLGVQ